MRTIIKIFDSEKVTIVSTPAPLTKITKKIRDGIINTNRSEININNQLILILFVYVNKYSYYLRCILWNI